MYLPDVNVWLALVFEAHAHHVPARTWFDEAGDKDCAFCRVTQQGFLRLATNPQVFGDDTLTLGAAWKCYDSLLKMPPIHFATEPPDVEQIWRQYTTAETYTSKVWTDAYLAAFAHAAKLAFVSFDKGIRRFADVHTVILGE